MNKKLNFNNTNLSQIYKQNSYSVSNYCLLFYLLNVFFFLKVKHFILFYFFLFLKIFIIN